MRGGLFAANIVVTLCCACSDTLVVHETQLAPHTSAQLRKAHPLAVSCLLWIRRLEDMREDKVNSGTVSGRPVQLPLFLETVRIEFAEEGLSNTASRDAKPLDVELLKAYASSQYETKAAHVVLRVRVNDSEPFIARGQDSVLNWSSGEDEIRRGFQRALHSSVESLFDQANKSCNR